MQHFSIRVTKAGVADDVAPADGTHPSTQIGRAARSRLLRQRGAQLLRPGRRAVGLPVANGQARGQRSGSATAAHLDQASWGHRDASPPSFERWGGLGRGCGAELFVQLVAVTRMGGAGVVVFAAPLGIRS